MSGVPGVAGSGFDELVEQIRKQSEEAQKFYEKLWNKKKEFYLDKILRREESKKTKTESEEIKEIRGMIFQIYRKYKQDFKEWLKTVENSKSMEGFKKLKEEIKKTKILSSEYDEFQEQREMFMEQLLALFARWLMAKLVFKKEVATNGAKVDVERLKKKMEIAKDLQKLYELGKKLAWETGKVPLFVATIEGEYLKCIGEFKKATTIMVELNGIKKTVKISRSRGEYIVKTEFTDKPVFPKKVIQYNKSPRAFAVMDFASVSCFGDIKEDFEYQFRQDLMGYLDEQGKRIVRIELINMNREDRLPIST